MPTSSDWLMGTCCIMFTLGVTHPGVKIRVPNVGTKINGGHNNGGHNNGGHKKINVQLLCTDG